MIKKNLMALSAAMMLLPMVSEAAPVDLSSWAVDGTSSDWNLALDNNSVVQAVNGQPTVFYNGVNSQGNALSGTIEVQTASDDDFVGFVLGYDAGDLSGPGASFILIDWKQGNQGSAAVGLSVSEVTGQLVTARAWDHATDATFNELQRATNLGSTGWADNTEYSFDLTFTSSLIEVFVDGVKEISIAGSFEDGSFGFYNYSQGNVRYAGIQEVTLPPVPLPAALPLLGAGLGVMGTLGWARRRKSA